MKGKRGTIKCIVWDLDGTIWNGILLEGEPMVLRDDVPGIIRTLDNRGIIHSIASKNSREPAVARLDALGLTDYFLYPHFGFGAKSDSIRRISDLLNIGLDSIAFVDDQDFELAEVAFSLPEVLCIDASRISDILTMPEMTPRFVTDDSMNRRNMYRAEIRRRDAELCSGEAPEAFLASLGMTVTISRACEADLRRAEELTERTHQFNTTGHTYSYDELDFFRSSPDHLLLLASLQDRYGPYGKVGLALVERSKGEWTIKLLLVSCRVLSRGIAPVLLDHLRNEAFKNNMRLRAEVIPNDTNVLTSVAYRMAGFREIGQDNDRVIYEDCHQKLHPFPEYLSVVIGEQHQMPVA